MGLKRVSNIGKSRTPGEQTGENQDSSKLKEVSMNAESNKIPARHSSDLSIQSFILYLFIIYL